MSKKKYTLNWTSLISNVTFQPANRISVFYEKPYSTIPKHHFTAGVPGLDRPYWRQLRIICVTLICKTEKKVSNEKSRS